MSHDVLSRREILRLSGVGSLSLLPASGRAAAKTDAAEQLDHLALGVNDLENGIAWLEAKLGVRPTLGNHHPGQGTRNAKLAMGAKKYLELLAPDPEQHDVDNPLLSVVWNFQTPTVFGWAAATHDIEMLTERLRSGGYEIESGETSVVQPDGERWSLDWIRVRSYFGGVVPWMVKSSQSSADVSIGAPSACRLMELKLEHPQEERINNLFALMGLRAGVTYAPVEKVTARLHTPKGEVSLGG